MNALDWNLCRTFVAVAEAGSYLGAARELGSSHPTVGRQIAALEAHLGVRLFARSRAGLELTDAGHRFRGHAEAMATAALRAQADMAAGGARPSGRVRLSIGPTLASHWLMPRLRGFLQQYPAIELELVTHPFPVSVLKREADLVLRLESGGENLIGRKIARLGAGLYASRDYGRRGPLPEGREDWQHHRVIGFAGLAANPGLARWSDRVTGPAAVALRCSSQADMLAAARAGLGIAALSCFVGDTYPDLVRVAPTKLYALAEIRLLAHPDLVDQPAMRAVIDFVTALARAEARLLSGAP
ncbi:LysR family transcriptional regulator [Chelatococcus reniformis]|uniref:LysR family transcriptional regulator n=1 Tax=Chelatococcus reniformis TaxID=1494448 RepID=A0A916UQR5_9HYPH|nr:LysR family transcriptional regulator [Chelatococcus reniformis]GGC82138.1 LysR family transcriptional regulator [Chelatococcus reniformis]